MTLTQALSDIEAYFEKYLRADIMNLRANLELQMAKGQLDDRMVRMFGGQVSGSMRRARLYICERLTDVVTEGREVSREQVRRFQKTLFGKSITSERLRRHTQFSRIGHWRPPADEIEIDRQLETQLAKAYEESLKRAEAIKEALWNRDD